MSDRRDDREIVEAILGLARALGLRVVAEGVETQDQLDRLRASGYEMLAQGYLYTPALPPDQLHDWLRRRQEDLTRLPAAPLIQHMQDARHAQPAQQARQAQATG